MNFLSLGGREKNVEIVYHLPKGDKTIKTVGLGLENNFNEWINHLLTKERLLFKSTPEEARQSVLSRIDGIRTIKPQRREFSFLRAAAVILVLILGGFSAYYFAGKTSFHNAKERVAIHKLPDGSTIILKRGATIEYNKNLWFLNREVDFNEGQAFFEVRKGKKFKVKTSLGNVLVLGTSFDVNLNRNNLIVACKTGKVQVDVPQKNTSLILIAGKEFDLNSNATAAIDIDVLNIASWTDSMHVFTNVDVSRVFEKLDDELDYDFNFENNLTSRYSGRINLNLPINEILEIVCVPTGLQYSVDTLKRKVYITKNE